MTAPDTPPESPDYASWTDEQWSKQLRAAELRAKHPGMVPTREDAAALAYLDRIVGELTEAQRDCLERVASDDEEVDCEVWRTLVDLRLLGGDCDVPYPSNDVEPLGRACLQRVKEKR